MGSRHVAAVVVVVSLTAHLAAGIACGVVCASRGRHPVEHAHHAADAGETAATIDGHHACGHEFGVVHLYSPAAKQMSPAPAGVAAVLPFAVPALVPEHPGAPGAPWRPPDGRVLSPPGRAPVLRL